MEYLIGTDSARPEPEHYKHFLTFFSVFITGGAIRGDLVEDGVARAVRLAANLSNQLFVDLPPEATAAASSASAASKETSNNAAMVNDLGGGGGNLQPQQLVKD